LNSFCCVELELILSESLNLLLTCACQLVGSGINADPFCLSQFQMKMRSKTKGGEITQPLTLNVTVWPMPVTCAFKNWGSMPIQCFRADVIKRSYTLKNIKKRIKAESRSYLKDWKSTIKLILLNLLQTWVLWYCSTARRI
jgi:hypothetical protein